MTFKATRMRDSTMDGQDKFIMRESDNAEVGVREDCDEDLLDVGCNVVDCRFICRQSREC